MINMLLEILLTVTLQAAVSQTKHDSFVGFTAFKEAPQEFAPGDRITFDGVLINEGDAYHPELSQFTCPVSGVYYVSLNMMADYDYMKAAVIIGEEIVLHAWSHVQNDRNTASVSGIAYCESEDVIYVAGDWDGKVYGEAGLQYTTFTVMLLSRQIRANVHISLNGFSVLKDDRSQSYENQDVIRYSKVTYNDGNYVTNSHRYECSKSGVYYINFNSVCDVREFLQLGIEHSANMTLHARDVTTMNIANAISNSRLIYCEAKETFVVKGTGSGGIFGSSSTLYSTFNGFLLATYGSAATHDNVIGASVFKRSPQSYNSSRVITFDGILWDEGNSYDRVLNRFDCPVTGVYYVSVTFVRHDSEPLYVQVQHQTLVDLQPVLISEDASGANPWNTIRNSGLVFCTNGDSLQVMSTGTGSVYGNSTDIVTTFTVFLMHQY